MKPEIRGSAPVRGLRSVPRIVFALLLGLLIVGCGSSSSGVAPSSPTSVAPSSPTSVAPSSPTSVAPSSPTSAASTSSVPAAQPAASAQTQTNEGGGVTIKATWAGPEAGPVFEVVLDTHSVDLDQYDLQELALLRVNGSQELRPVAWEAPKGGHHREGKLSFPATLPAGGPTLGEDLRTLELVIRDVGGVPTRSLQWTR
jgi:hypothetical protein